MKKVLIFLLHMYKSFPTEAHKACRFTPTCSEYMEEAINEYGVLKGVKLGIKRIIRCHPFGKYGYDPVPKKENI